MTRFTRRIRALAARTLSAKTVERLIDPVLSDIELERREHLRRGSVWRVRRVVASGYFSLSKALISHALYALAGACVFDAAAVRTVRVSCIALTVVTTALVLPPLLSNRLFTQHPLLAVYLVPQAIPIGIPIALSMGIVWSWSSQTGAMIMLRRLVVVSVAGAIISLATMEWLVPAAHDGFLASLTRLSGRGGNPPAMHRGLGERSLSELTSMARQMSNPASSTGHHGPTRQGLRARPGRSFTVADVKLALHTRMALSGATIALAMLAVGIAAVIHRRTVGRAIFGTLVVLYLASWLGAAAIPPAVPPALSAWLPNAAVVAVGLGFVFARTRLARLHEIPTA